MLRASPHAPEAGILLPGEPERVTARERAAQGIPLPQTTCDALRDAGLRAGSERSSACSHHEREGPPRPRIASPRRAASQVFRERGDRMTRRHVAHFTVEFGDCDPAGIVFYPNFFRWMDAASLHYFRAAGVPPWRDFEAQRGIIGTPLVDASARFVAAGDLRRRASRSTRRSTNGAARAS